MYVCLELRLITFNLESLNTKFYLQLSGRKVRDEGTGKGGGSRAGRKKVITVRMKHQSFTEN